MKKSYRKSRRRFVNVRIPVEFVPLLNATHAAKRQWKKGGPDAVFTHDNRTLQDAVLERLSSGLAGFLMALYDVYEDDLEGWDTDRLLAWLSSHPGLNHQDSLHMLSRYTTDMWNWDRSPDGKSWLP